ncbi:MAG: PKD domain-containing protein [Granulosicoccus sp.]
MFTKYISLLLVLLAGAPQIHATEELMDGLPASVHIAEGFNFIPVTQTVREVRDYFNQNSGTVSDFALVGPTVMAAPPGVDGHLFVGTQRGQVFHVAFDRDDNDHPVITSMEPMLDIRDKVSAAIDRGLIGMAVHPDFEDGSGRLYLSYTHANGDLDGYYDTACFDPTLGSYTCTEVKKKTAGLAWYQIEDFVGDPATEQLILGKIRGTPDAPSCSDYAEDANCIYSDSGSHTVGGVAFDPDTGAVCLATGDGAGFYKAEPDAVRAARFDNLSGKLLCVDPDTGLGLPSNPYWTGDPNDFASRIVVYGLRNPYRFMFSDERELIIFMVGWNQVESAYRIATETGGYVGWPCHGVETMVTDYRFLDACDFDAPEPVIPPQYQYNHLPENNYQAAIVGAARFGPLYPDWLEGRYIAGDYRNDWVRILRTDENTGLWVDGIDLAYGTDPENPIELGAPVMFYNDTAGRVYMMSFLSGSVDGYSIGTIYEIVYSDPAQIADPGSDASSDDQLTVARFDYEPIDRNLIFSFDGANSTINDQPLADSDNVMFLWDFQDGSPEVESLGTITHQFPRTGDYEVALSLISEAGEVLSRTVREVRVADPRFEAEPYVLKTLLPGHALAISESFDVGVEFDNFGEEEPFCAVLNVSDEITGDTAREVHRCLSLPTDTITVVSFPLLFSEPGNFIMTVRFHAATSDLPDAEPTAFLGDKYLGSLRILNRSGLTEPAPDPVDSDDISSPANDENDVNDVNDVNDETDSFTDDEDSSSLPRVEDQNTPDNDVLRENTQSGGAIGVALLLLMSQALLTSLLRRGRSHRSLQRSGAGCCR